MIMFNISPTGNRLKDSHSCLCKARELRSGSCHRAGPGAQDLLRGRSDVIGCCQALHIYIYIVYLFIYLFTCIFMYSYTQHTHTYITMCIYLTELSIYLPTYLSLWQVLFFFFVLVLCFSRLVYVFISTVTVLSNAY